MFASVGSWVFKYVGGIRLKEPGYKRVSLSPSCLVSSELSDTSAWLMTHRGNVSVDCSADAPGSVVWMTVAVPIGVLADVTIPALQFTTADSTTLSDSSTGNIFWKDGKFIKGAVPGILEVAANNGRNYDSEASTGIVVTTGSGIYSFKADGQVARPATVVG